MEKILSINSNPFMHAYTHHGYLHAIASAEDRVNHNASECVADIKVEDYDSFEWRLASEELVCRFSEDRHLHFFTNKWNYGMNSAFWRDCRQEDSIRLTIYKQLFSNAWSNISVFITAKDTNEIMQLNSYDIVAGNFSKDGVFYSNKKGFHERIRYGLLMPLTVGLFVENKKIFLQYENESFKSEKIQIACLEKEYTDYFIGFSVNLGNSIYYEWMFSNYIQLFSKVTDIIPIDFIVNWHKDWCVHTANHLIDYNRINQRDLAVMGISLLDFVKLQIKTNQYVEIELNDNMKWDRSDEEYGAYFHQNLIYGFSDQQECLFVLYYENGIITKTQISYSDFESKRNYKESRMIYMLKYNPLYEKYELSIRRILNVFKEYQAGDNISFFDPFYDDYKIGANCYRQYLDSELLKIKSWDMRFTHLLYERSSCNANRIEYLYYRKIIKKEEYEELIDLIKSEGRMMLLARNTIVKGRRNNNVSIDKLQEYIKNAFEKDQVFTQRIIECLNTKLGE